MNIPTVERAAGTTVAGKVSWFGGPHDAETGNSKTASGAPTSVPGIAIYNRATLGGYWKVTAANGKSAVLKQTDLGPAPFTGRKIDVTYSALGKLGYNEGNFPTDSTFKATYLGQDPGAAATAAKAVSPLPVQGASPALKGPAATAPITKTELNLPALQKAEQGVALNRILLPATGGGADNPLRLVMGTAAPSAANFEKTVTVSPATPATAGSPSNSGAGAGGVGNAPISQLAPTDVKLGANAPMPAEAASRALANTPQAQKAEVEKNLAGTPTSRLEEFGYTRQGGKIVPVPVVTAPTAGRVAGSYRTPNGTNAIVHHANGKIEHVRSNLPVGHRYVGGEVLGSPIGQQGG
jgi:hypothetical protein